MFKNVAAKFVVFAFDATTNVPKTGDAAQITAYVSKDYGTVTVLADTSATEFDATNAPGYYWFDAAQAETNADCLMVTAKSSTANIKVIGAPAIIYTRPTTGWLAPTVAGRTLDVSAGGEAGVDWANVGSPTTANALTSTTIATTQKVDVETIKTNPVVNAGTITFPTTATLASTTNITAGTITTVTNLTNLPAITANWLTAAGTAADFGAEIADAVWDEAIAGHVAAGSTGEALSAAGGAGDPWITALPGAYSAGQAGKIVGDYLNAAVGSRATQTSVDTIDDFLDTEIAAIKAKTDNLPAAPAATGDCITAAGVRTAVGLASANLDTQLTTIAGYTDSMESRLPAALVGGRMDATVSAIDGDTTALAAFKAAVRTNITGTVGAASSTTSVVTSSMTPAASVTDQFKGLIIKFDLNTSTAALRGQASDITASTSGGVLTVTALTTAPANGDTFAIL